MNPAHLDYDVLADLAEGLLEDDQAASVNAHLDTCADCRDLSTELVDVSRILAEAPAPSIPAELAERIDTAIAAESLSNATVASMEQRRGRRHWRTFSAAAAAVIVVGGGAVVGSVALNGASSTDSTASAPAHDQPREDAEGAGPAAARGFQVHRSGTEYRAGDLGPQVTELLNGGRVGTATGASEPRLRDCVYAVTRGKAPALVDEAAYEGDPAYVIATHGTTSGKWDVWVVSPTCSATDHQVLKKLENA